MTATLDRAVDAIAAALVARDLTAAQRAFDMAVGGDRAAVGPLVQRLAATVVIPPGMVVWGFGLDIWANPYRDVDEYAWRCGDCRWTASHYRTENGAQESAKQHVADHHRGQPSTVVSYLDETYWDAVSTAEARSDMSDRQLTPEQLAQLQEDHSEAVAQQRRDRDELAAKQQSDDAWGEEIEQRWGKQ